MRKLLPGFSTMIVGCILLTGCTNADNSTMTSTKPMNVTNTSTTPLITTSGVTTAKTQPKTTNITPTPSTDASNTGQVSCSRYELVSDVKENNKLIRKLKLSFYFSLGAIKGTITEVSTFEIDLADNKLALVGEGTFDGTINGKKGTLNVTEVGNGDISSIGLADYVSGSYVSRYSIIDGTGDLARLQGKIDFDIDFHGPVFKGIYLVSLEH
jgi:hypothetical protein